MLGLEIASRKVVCTADLLMGQCLHLKSSQIDMIMITQEKNYLIGIFMVYHWKSDIDTNVGIDILLGYISYDNVFQ